MSEPRPAQCPNPELHAGHVSEDGQTWCAGLDGTEVPPPPCPACVAVACPSCGVPAGQPCTVTRPDLYGPTHADRREVGHR